MSDTNFYNYLDPLIDTMDDVLIMRQTAITLWKNGIKTMEWTGEGTSAKKQWVAPTETILRETRHFLKLSDPVKYGKIVRTSRQFRLS